MLLNRALLKKKNKIRPSKCTRPIDSMKFQVAIQTDKTKLLLLLLLLLMWSRRKRLSVVLCERDTLKRWRKVEDKKKRPINQASCVRVCLPACLCVCEENSLNVDFFGRAERRGRWLRKGFSISRTWLLETIIMTACTVAGSNSWDQQLRHFLISPSP